jgi:hypothetical protein
MSGLRLSRGDCDTFGEAGLLVAERWGLEHEYLESYARNRESGLDDGQAAFYACYDWDILELVDE